MSVDSCTHAHTHSSRQWLEYSWHFGSKLIDWTTQGRAAHSNMVGLRVGAPEVSEDALHAPAPPFVNTSPIANHIWQWILIRWTGRINACWLGRKYRAKTGRLVKSFLWHLNAYTYVKYIFYDFIKAKMCIKTDRLWVYKNWHHSCVESMFDQTQIFIHTFSLDTHMLL